MYTAEDFYCDYQIYINGQFADETDDVEEVWKIIGEYPFGSRYEVGSATGKDIGEFVPF